jgi:hypothetical protein
MVGVLRVEGSLTGQVVGRKPDGYRDRDISFESYSFGFC